MLSFTRRFLTSILTIIVLPVIAGFVTGSISNAIGRADGVCASLPMGGWIAILVAAGVLAVAICRIAGVHMFGTLFTGTAVVALSAASGLAALLIVSSSSCVS